jgi:hypothetical protein
MKSTQLLRFVSIASLLMLCFTVGCNPPTPKKKVAKEKGTATGILNKTTTKVGEWDPDAGLEIVVEDGEDINMINRNMKTLGKVNHKIAILRVQDGLNKYRALEGHYPKTYEEFMEKAFPTWIIKLPEPLTTCEYQYDVENHELLIVKKKSE